MGKLPFCVSRIDYLTDPENVFEATRITPDEYDPSQLGEFVCPYCGWRVNRVKRKYEPFFAHSRPATNDTPPWCSIRVTSKKNGYINKSQEKEFSDRGKLITLIETSDSEPLEVYPPNDNPVKRKPPVRFNSVETLLRYLYQYFDNAILLPGDDEPRLVSTLIKPITDTEYDPDVVYLWYGKIERFKIWREAYAYLNISSDRSDPSFQITTEFAEKRHISSKSVGRYVAVLGHKWGNYVKAQSLKMVDLIPENRELFFKINDD
ncbi:MAG: hypothetical protein HWE39_12900 [Oceanospirillaceae bacterium]|nr:hypothetical protein [Oceanospirillaceae bacterium]